MKIKLWNMVEEKSQSGPSVKKLSMNQAHGLNRTKNYLLSVEISIDS